MIKQILHNCEADCTVLIRKPQVISGGGGAHPLHPPPRSASVTPPSLSSTPQINTSVNALHPDSKKVTKPTSELLDDAIFLNENRHCLPIAKEYVLSQFKDIYRGGGLGQIPHLAQARRKTCTSSTSSST